MISPYAKVRAADGHGALILKRFRDLPRVARDDEHSQIWTIRRCGYETLVKQVLPQFGARLRIVDLGAGIGWLCARLSELGHEPVAVDIATEGIDGLAASLAFNPTWPLVQANFDHLPFATATADLVIFNGSFHYSADYELTLREAVRVVKAGGAVVIMDTPIYRSAASGEQMTKELLASLRQHYGSEPIKARHFLTWQNIEMLGHALGLSWQIHRPRYGIRWRLRPVIAKLRGKREPASFAVLVARQLK